MIAWYGMSQVVNYVGSALGRRRPCWAGLGQWQLYDHSSMRLKMRDNYGHFFQCCCEICAYIHMPLQWRHNERDGVSNHRRLDCLLNRLFRRTLMKTPMRSIGNSISYLGFKLAAALGISTTEIALALWILYTFVYFKALDLQNSDEESWWRHSGRFRCYNCGIFMAPFSLSYVI